MVSEWTRTVLAASGEDRPLVTTIPDVELCEVGTWNLASGVTTFTTSDFESSIAAQDDPFIRTPKIKVGHTDPRFDGEPTFGKIDNMRLSADKQTLIGDLVGVPTWMADIMPYAWPQRSIEGQWEVKTAAGKTHHFVITGLALLGDTDPGVETLEDLKTLWENGPIIEEGTPVEATVSVPVAEGEVDMKRVRAAIHAAANKLRNVEASVDVEDLRRSYYDTLDQAQMWWWIRAIQVDPPQLIVDDDEGSLYRVPYTVGSDEVTFGDPTPVAIQYVDVEQKKTAASKELAVYASKEESRPEGGNGMTPEQLKKLGLPEDATQEQIDAKLDELLQANADPEPGTTPEEKSGQDAPETEGEPKGDDEKEPEGTAPTAQPEAVQVDPATLEEMKVAAARGNEVWKEAQEAKRNKIVDEAVEAGKFPPSRRDHYLSLLEKDFDGTKSFIDTLAAGVIPVVERGHGNDGGGGPEPDAYPAHWLPEVQAQKQGVNA